MQVNDEPIDEVADLISQSISAGMTMQAALDRYRRLLNVPETLLQSARVKYESAVGIIRAVHDPAALMSEETRKAVWYAGPKPGDIFWPAVSARLGKSLDDSALESVDMASSKVLSVMSPSGLTEFSTRGLVLGYVQSGKTTSFMSVIAKAADRGYRVFIVLSGVTDNLRNQTQERVDEVLLGPDAKGWYLLTTAESDFSEGPDNASSLLQQRDLRFIAIVKKNPARLRKLRDWLNAAGRPVIANSPVLLIDDEADQASVDISKSGGRASTINKLLREVLDRPKAAYVAYTATPFANMLIDPGTPGDLYPSDFIVSLPESEHYFGSERLFGRAEKLTEEDSTSDGLDVIRTIPTGEAERARPPRGKGAVFGWEPCADDALVRSLRWFFLSTAARRVRELGNEHATMLIHTSMLAEAHRRTAEVVHDEIERTKRALTGNDAHEIGLLRKLYDEETKKVPAEDFGHVTVPFDELLGAIGGVLESTKIVVDNYQSEDRLSYKKDHPSATVVVGGNTLSRGLTLEGLSSSYFVRSASAYDTLLQMGRWFGYRRGYEDLCRIWMTDELAKWFRDLSLVEAEIRQEISKYELEGISPSQVAVRIRSHPDMAITAAAKMRNAVAAEMSYSSLRPQTILFASENKDWLEANIKAVRLLSAAASNSGRPERVFPSGRRGFSNVDASDILRFIGNYQFHPDAQSLKRTYLNEYIAKEIDANSLSKWNIVFMENTSSTRGGVDLGLSSALLPLERSKLKASKDGVANLKAIASTMDRVSDLELQPDEVRRRALRYGNTITDATLLKVREEELPDRGLLCIYPINGKSVPSQGNVHDLRVPLDAVADLVGLTFFFPRSRGSHSSVTYMSADLSALLLEDPTDESDQIAAADDADRHLVEEIEK